MKRLLPITYLKKIIVCLMVMSPIDIFGQDLLTCFTHPFSSEPIPLFSKPNVYMKDLCIDVDGEAGYEVIPLRKEDGFILVHFPCCEYISDEKQAWVKIGDLGVVVQNYDNYSIPVYTQPDSLSTIQTYLLKSYIGLLYDWTDDFVMLQIKDKDVECFGWIDRSYICGSPYTTCN